MLNRLAHRLGYADRSEFLGDYCNMIASFVALATVPPFIVFVAAICGAF